MRIEPGGWLRGAAKLLSPNFDLRSSAGADLLVIHGISLPPGKFGTGDIARLFCNCLDTRSFPEYDSLEDLQVSAHFLIERNGALFQFVPLGRCAWHAGVSAFCGRSGCNDFSIGIELEGTDEIAYTEPQYQSLLQVTRVLRRAYPAITHDRIVGHCDIAPGRKTDPGPRFDWDRYRAALTEFGEGNGS